MNPEVLLGVVLMAPGALVLLIWVRGLRRLPAGQRLRGSLSSAQWVHPALGTTMILIGALWASGAPEAALMVMAAGGGLAALGMTVAAARALRARDRRQAAWHAGNAAFVVAAGVLIALERDVALYVLFGLVAVGIITAGVRSGVRSWAGATGSQRSGMLAPVGLGIALLCQAVADLLPTQLRVLVWTFYGIGVAALLATTTLLVLSRRHDRSSSPEPGDGRT